MKTKLEKFIEERGNEELDDTCVLCEVAGIRCSSDCPTIKELFAKLNEPYIEKKTFSVREITILKSVDDDFKYITRDKNGLLYINTERPLKRTDEWKLQRGLARLFPFNSIFQQITWEDDEPVNIQEVVKEYKDE